MTSRGAREVGRRRNRGAPAPAAVEPRLAVRRFAEAMEAKLQKNDRKGGWRGCEPGWLLLRLVDEVGELAEAALHLWRQRAGASEDDRRAVLAEAADVANFAMMVADVCGALGPPAGKVDGGQVAAAFLSGTSIGDLAASLSVERATVEAALRERLVVRSR